MPDFLTSFLDGPKASPLEVSARLIIAALLGTAVAWIYRRTRKSTDIAASFPTTLVLLAVLIAMVTQVIGDNIARAFSLVGALSIVRFRTVVRDTQDTAYVIFAVVVGMAVGASNLWISVIGLGVVGATAYLMMTGAPSFSVVQPAFVLTVRVGLGNDPDHLLAATLDAHVSERELMSVATGKQGIALDLIYETRLRPDITPNQLVTAVNLLEGVQKVQLQRRNLNGT